MNSSFFIKEKLLELVSFPGIESIRYGLSKCTGSHLIEIVPSSLFNDKIFKEIEYDIVEEFEESFPGNDIIFITDHDIVSIHEQYLFLTPEINFNSYEIL